MRKFPKYVVDVLRRGGVGIIPTDTIYGIVGIALDRRVVARIYKLRRRNAKKPFIVLVHSAATLKNFGVRLDKYHKLFLAAAWPGPVSVVLSVSAAKYKYLHRGKRSLAFRVPVDAALRDLLRRTGPLVAPSANWEGQRPARTIKEAQKFFGSHVEFYVDGGRAAGKPSTLIDFTGKKPVILRK